MVEGVRLHSTSRSSGEPHVAFDCCDVRTYRIVADDRGGNRYGRCCVGTVLCRKHRQQAAPSSDVQHANGIITAAAPLAGSAHRRRDAVTVHLSIGPERAAALALALAVHARVHRRWAVGACTPLVCAVWYGSGAIGGGLRCLVALGVAQHGDMVVGQEVRGRALRRIRLRLARCVGRRGPM